ncbi:MAG: replication-associated recombination protein A [Chlamydia sp.]
MSQRSLSEQFRPRLFQDLFGQERWMQKDGLIESSLVEKRPMNLLLWGPPGIGKTSFATIYLHSFDLPTVTIHPSRFQMAQMKEILDRAESQPLFRPTIIWIDEIHRLTRPQQDVLLKGMEDQTICLISATTENPSFALSNALLSRLQVLTFSSLKPEDLLKIMNRVTIAYPDLSFSTEVAQLLIEKAQGDGRKLLSFIEPLTRSKNLQKHYEKSEELQLIATFNSGPITAHGEGKYLLISALHKAIRGSDVQAALYWLARIIHSGEDLLYITRRLIRMALEDIGLADPEALQICFRAQESYKALGSPEGDLALFQAVVYLALSPKSASTYVAMKAVMKVAESTGHLAPPKHILNAPTSWMKQEGFGQEYIWDHDTEDGFSGQNYFPDGVQEDEYYRPVERGFERELIRRNEYFKNLRVKRRAYHEEK